MSRSCFTTPSVAYTTCTLPVSCTAISSQRTSSLTRTARPSFAIWGWRGRVFWRIERSRILRWMLRRESRWQGVRDIAGLIDIKERELYLLMLCPGGIGLPRSFCSNQSTTSQLTFGVLAVSSLSYFFTWILQLRDKSCSQESIVTPYHQNQREKQNQSTVLVRRVRVPLPTSKNLWLTEHKSEKFWRYWVL